MDQGFTFKLLPDHGDDFLEVGLYRTLKIVLYGTNARQPFNRIFRIILRGWKTSGCQKPERLYHLGHYDDGKILMTKQTFLQNTNLQYTGCLKKMHQLYDVISLKLFMSSNFF